MSEVANERGILPGEGVEGGSGVDIGGSPVSVEVA